MNPGGQVQLKYESLNEDDGLQTPPFIQGELVHDEISVQFGNWPKIYKKFVIIE